MSIIIIKSSGGGKNLWQILADFVADTKKPLEYQGVMRS